MLSPVERGHRHGYGRRPVDVARGEQGPVGDPLQLELVRPQAALEPHAPAVTFVPTVHGDRQPPVEGRPAQSSMTADHHTDQRGALPTGRTGLGNRPESGDVHGFPRPRPHHNHGHGAGQRGQRPQQLPPFVADSAHVDQHIQTGVAGYRPQDGQTAAGFGAAGHYGRDLLGLHQRTNAGQSLRQFGRDDHLLQERERAGGAELQCRRQRRRQKAPVPEEVPNRDRGADHPLRAGVLRIVDQQKPAMDKAVAMGDDVAAVHVFVSQQPTKEAEAWAPRRQRLLQLGEQRPEADVFLDDARGGE